MVVATRRFKLAVIIVVAVSLGCAGRPAPATSARSDRSLITREQLLEHHFTTVYEALQALRSNWLLTKGTDSFTNPTEVQVYLDNVRMGGVATLRTIATTTVQWVRYYDGLAAAARWGLDHGQGVIFVSTGGR